MGSAGGHGARIARTFLATVIVLSGGLAYAGDPYGSQPKTRAKASRAKCSLAYDLPADIGVTLPSDTAQKSFDELSWQTFLALNAPQVGGRVTRKGDNDPQWRHWSSTVDLIECQRDATGCVCPGGDCNQSGARRYPAECRAIPDHEQYRVISMLSKVDDNFLEAATGGLSNSPVLDSEGHFLRFEILVSPAAYDFVVANDYTDASVLTALTTPVVFPCGDASYTGGDPANPQMGAIIVKNAWMELGSRRARHFHTEPILIYTPASRSSTGLPSCRLVPMALVGMHIAHKTTKQAPWIWSTFEHDLNTPECTALPPAGNQQGSGPSTACPARVRRAYNFYPKKCAKRGSDPGACQTCNATPVSNAAGCATAHTGDTSWCLDLPPNPVAGLSKLCRQVPVKKNYPTAHRQNRACARKLGGRSVWRRYQLISTQWYNAASSTCQNGSTSTFQNRDLLLPQVDLTGTGASPRPFLANTSMESYVRSDCTGCHQKSTVDGTSKTVSTDLMYWLQLEAAATD
jgi:hypothetical protein